jgi:hypothetical protein
LHADNGCSGGSGGVRPTHGPRLGTPRMFCQFCCMQVGADRADAWACSRDVGGSILARAMAFVCSLVIVIMVMAEFMGTPEALVSYKGMRDCSLALLLISFACDQVVKEAQSSCCCECAHSGLGFVGIFYRACRAGMCTSCQRRQTEWTFKLLRADSPEQDKSVDSGNNCSEELEIDEFSLELDRSDLGGTSLKPSFRP